MERFKKGFNIFINDLKGIWLGVFAFFIYSFAANTFLDRYCPMTLLSGLPCPACGMTRASFLLLKGRFFDAIMMHPMVLSVLLFFIAFCLFRYVLFIDTKILTNLLIFIIVLGVLVYIMRMFTFFPNRVPMVYYPENYVYRIISFFKKTLTYSLMV